MTPPPPCRLSLVFAAEAPVAVIVRRGPSRWAQVTRWNTATDTLETGTWFHGRIYAERCGLSPDGALFVYFAMKYGPVNTAAGYKWTYTAISRPPYLTALAMWPQGDTWGGGGRFIDRRTLRLAYGLSGTSHPGVADTTLYMGPLPAAHPNHPPVGLRILGGLDRYDPDLSFRTAPATNTHWQGRDHGGRAIEVRDGALYSWNARNERILLRDFNGDVPQPIAPPPEAAVWPNE